MSIIEGIIILVFLIVLPILFVSGNSSMTMVNYQKIEEDAKRYNYTEEQKRKIIRRAQEKAKEENKSFDIGCAIFAIIIIIAILFSI